ncbi:hypothetical protein MMC26_001042 [Xylographa opegraphella]|nr:hypothetical protein [Xylographa opegraphella]
MPRRQPTRSVAGTRLESGSHATNGGQLENSLVDGDEDSVPELSKSKKRSADASDTPKLSKKARLTRTKSDDKDHSQPAVAAAVPKATASRGKVVVDETISEQPIATKKGEEERPTKSGLRGKPSWAKVAGVEAVVEEEEEILVAKPKRVRKVTAAAAIVAKEEEVEFRDSPRKTKKAKKIESTVLVKEEGADEPERAQPSPKQKRARKTKEEKEREAMPLAARTQGLRMYIGAHVSCAKGVQNTVTNAAHIGANSFACFLKSQRKWDNPPLQDDHRDQFHSFCAEHKYESAKYVELYPISDLPNINREDFRHVVPHGSYLVNLAQEDTDRAKQAYDAFIDDLKRCEALGIKLYNFHPGSTLSQPRPQAISRIAAALNRAHMETSTVKPLLENMAGAGNVIGATFEDLRDIIEQVEDKSRIGVCIDTCHTFAAGYDLRTPEAFNNTLDQFDKIVGMQYLSALHINDSKGPFRSHRDLHQNIGLGFLGLRAFHNVMNEPRFENLPLVLETPIDSKDSDGKPIEDKKIWATEIKLLESLIGMDPESDEFKTLERDLATKGAQERHKLQDAFERKQDKDQKAAQKGKVKSKGKSNSKKKQAAEGGDSSSAGGLSDISD